MPFLGLFRDLRNQTVFEGSDIVLVRGQYYVVFDSSYSIGVLDDRFQFLDPVNKLIGDKGMNDSQFEGIAYDPAKNTFHLMREAILHGDEYRPSIVTVKVDEEEGIYDVVSKCPVDFALSHENKGFEGLMHVTNSKGSFLFGLCEGNHCSGGARGRDSGQGRIVVLVNDDSGENGCGWKPHTVLKLPKSADFVDYSGIALEYTTGRLAVLSQENSAFWVGDFDVETFEFTSDGFVVNLPRNHDCEIVYCNAEGIQWIDQSRVIVVSDKAKSKQPFICDEKDQSVHIFALPPARIAQSPPRKDLLAF